MVYRDTRIAVFYHCAVMGAWEAVNEEIMTSMKASGLLDHAELTRNVCSDVSLFEFPTIDMLRDYAKDNDGVVLYLHTKGVSRTGPSIDDWRAAMLYWMVERWKECVDKLLKGFDVVGYTKCDRPLPHFQGNFWWAKTSYLRTLDDVRNIKFVKSVSNQGERHKAEFWILSKPGRFYEPYNHKVRPYCELNPRSRYINKPF